MTSPAGEPIVATVYDGNRKVGATLAALFGGSLAFPVIAAIQDHNVVLAVLFGVPGIALLAAVIPIYRGTSPHLIQLIFDADGFRFSTAAGSWFVRWDELSAIRLHRVYLRYRDSDGGVVAGARVSLDFWPADPAMATRPDLAHLWVVDDTGGHFRRWLLNSGTSTMDIERGVDTFRPGLWRGATTADLRKGPIR